MTTWAVVTLHHNGTTTEHVAIRRDHGEQVGWHTAHGWVGEVTGKRDLLASELGEFHDEIAALVCHNGHPFEPGVSVDHMPGESDPRWCNVCGELRASLKAAS